MGVQMSFAVQVFIAAVILYAAALAMLVAARIERRAALYDRQQAAEDFATVQKALVLFNCGAKEEAMSTITRLGVRPDGLRAGTTARDFIASKSRIPPPNISRRLL